jgi:RNA polymerase sigma factor (sigma-70 family)
MNHIDENELGFESYGIKGLSVSNPKLYRKLKNEFDRKINGNGVCVYENDQCTQVELHDCIDEQTISVEDSIANTELQTLLLDNLGTLTQRQSEVIKMRFGIGSDVEHTLEEVGEHFQLSMERVRQIETKALRMLRHPSRSTSLKHALYN